MLKQFSLERKSAAVAGQRAVAADHPVAGHDQGDGVGAVGRADGAGSRGMADLLGDRAIAGGGAEGNIHQRLPHLAVEVRTFRQQFEFEVPALAVAVLRHLALHLGQLARIVFRFRVDLGRAGRAQVEAQQPALLVHPGGHLLERRVDRRPVTLHAASFEIGPQMHGGEAAMRGERAHQPRGAVGVGAFRQLVQLLQRRGQRAVAHRGCIGKTAAHQHIARRPDADAAQRGQPVLRRQGRAFAQAFDVQPLVGNRLRGINQIARLGARIAPAGQIVASRCSPPLPAWDGRACRRSSHPPVPPDRGAGWWRTSR